MADPTLTSRTPGVAPALRPTAAPATELVRLVDLVAGQRVQATVIEPPALGRVLVGLLGGVVEATTNLPLEVGRSYEFTVSATEPRIVLKAPSPSTLPSPDTAVAAGLLGPAASEIAALVHAVRALVRTTTGQPAAGGGDPQAALDAAVARLADGAADASDLQTIARRLGHDQEARVLRLPAQPAARELTELRGTLKAQALLLLADAATAETEPARRAAGKLVAGLNHIEADNAARAEQGSPLWLPLPVSAGSFLRDARMFLVGDDERRADATESRPYRIVLLLDLTRLGPLRVDIEVRDARLSAASQPHPNGPPSLREVGPAPLGRASVLQEPPGIPATPTFAGILAGRQDVRAGRPIAAGPQPKGSRHADEHRRDASGAATGQRPVSLEPPGIPATPTFAGIFAGRQDVHAGRPIAAGPQPKGSRHADEHRRDASGAATGQRPVSLEPPGIPATPTFAGILAGRQDVHDGRLSATFQVARESSLHRLQPAFAALRSELEGAGLEVRALELRLAPAGQLPVGDLLSPPRPAQSTSRVDVHV